MAPIRSKAGVELRAQVTSIRTALRAKVGFRAHRLLKHCANGQATSACWLLFAICGGMACLYIRRCFVLPSSLPTLERSIYSKSILWLRSSRSPATHISRCRLGTRLVGTQAMRRFRKRSCKLEHACRAPAIATSDVTQIANILLPVAHFSFPNLCFLKCRQ